MENPGSRVSLPPKHLKDSTEVKVWGVQMLLPTFRAGLTSECSLEAPPRHMQRFVSWVVLNPTKLTARITCHGGLKGESSQPCETSIKQVTSTGEPAGQMTYPQLPHLLSVYLRLPQNIPLLFTINVQDHFQKICSFS